MSEERRRILDMMKNGKITMDEAEELLDALAQQGTAVAGTEQAAKGKPRYLRVLVHDKEDNVDVRVPLQLLRAGIKLGALIPGDAQAKVTGALGEKGINFDLGNMDPKAVEELIEAIGDLSVSVSETNGTNVRVFCE